MPTERESARVGERLRRGGGRETDRDGGWKDERGRESEPSRTEKLQRRREPLTPRSLSNFGSTSSR